MSRTEDQHEWHEIVGVVGPFGIHPTNPSLSAGAYHPIAAGSIDPMNFAVEVEGDPADFVSTFREAVYAADPEATPGNPDAA